MQCGNRRILFLGRRTRKGRALESVQLNLPEVLKKVKKATYEINMKRILKEGAVVGLANGIKQMEKLFIQLKI